MVRQLHKDRANMRASLLGTNRILKARWFWHCWLRWLQLFFCGPYGTNRILKARLLLPAALHQLHGSPRLQLRSWTLPRLQLHSSAWEKK